MNRQKGFSIYPDAKLMRLIREEAKKEKRSISNFILNILENHINNKHE